MKLKKRLLPILAAFIAAFIFFGCGLFTTPVHSFPLIIAEELREENPFRFLRDCDTVYTLSFSSSHLDPIEVQLRELLEIASIQRRRPDFGTPLRVSLDVQESFEIAIEILDRIILNDFTPIQRIRAIHDYLAYHIEYDHELFERWAQQPNVHLDEFERMSFELTGVFLNRRAVCDGLAKAFKLMCAIEGIEARYVIGTFGEGLNSMPHAWNKVRMGDSWYNVDVTLANFYFVVDGRSSVTVLNHGFFMRSDRSLRLFGGHREAIADDQPWIVPEALGEYPFFKNNYFAGIEGLSMHATNADELEAIFRAVRAENRRVGAIQVHLDFTDNVDNLNRLAFYAPAIERAYRAVPNSNFSFRATDLVNPPFAQYPGGVFVFLIYI
ncbi:MAG: hypothetical protein FWC82_01740 [Firmicutes bacterium]|nr:hypothetical protein [Bacillota bacterium]